MFTFSVFEYTSSLLIFCTHRQIVRGKTIHTYYINDYVVGPFKNNDWIDAVRRISYRTHLDPNRCLLRTIEDICEGQQRTGNTYLYLVTNDWDGDVCYLAELLLKSLHDYTWVGDSGAEVYLKESGIHLNIFEPMFSSYSIETQSLAPLIENRTGRASATALYYGEEHLSVSGFLNKDRTLCSLGLKFRGGQEVERVFAATGADDMKTIVFFNALRETLSGSEIVC